MYGSRTTGCRLLPVLVALVAGMATTSAPALAASNERTEPIAGPGPGPGVTSERALRAATPVTIAAVPANDAPAAAQFLTRDIRLSADTTDAGAVGEPDGTNIGCPYDWSHTVWYRVKGNGGRVTFDTWGSEIDTMIAVYAGNTATPIGCYDTRSIGGPEHEHAGITVTTTTAGLDYYVQVGSPGTLPGGTILLSYIASDDRAHPAVLAPGASNSTTVGATYATGETIACSGTAYYDTTWYRINVTEPGTLRFNATGVGWYPAATLYPAGSATALPGCALGNNGARTATLGTYLRRGAYDLQVGAIDTWGYYTYTYTFDIDPDEDRDTWNRAPYNGARPPDCNDGAGGGAINPGATDVKDGISNDCDQYIDEDVDGDGEDALFAGGNDCYPNDGRFPTTREVRGNGIDENCDGRKEYPSFATVQVAPGFTRPVAFDALRIRPVPKGATLRIRCKGGGCPRGSFKKHFSRRKTAYSAIGYVKRIAIHSNTVVEVRITRRYTIGKYVKIFIHSNGRPDKIERCLRPGKSKPSACA